ncbi:hypothetical protein BOTBODRAFT_57661 [Botryobasidium botryosum FD-172 SS1]|uniref:F-box domain-containing protein n=1 Tax=Botryobasidium botryosum (strain FD-172 SS1) TaxID=930990 RepID=A0A067MHT0_BOTB1|nr:hypothetical protein BOTBODRAFT_57661 [Botryobasidium botryosum FD-172 SS1]
MEAATPAAIFHLLQTIGEQNGSRKVFLGVDDMTRLGSGDFSEKQLDEECDSIVSIRDSAICAVNSYVVQLLIPIKSYRNQLQPINRMPIDVLAQIFRLVEQPDDDRHLLSARAPLNIAQVSRQWRDIAFDTPNLWSKIDVMNAHMAEIFLARSKAALLDIELTRPYPADAFTRNICHAHTRRMKNLQGFMDSLRPHMDRWRSFMLHGESFMKQGVLGAALTSPAPQLARLSIMSADFSSERGLPLNNLFDDHAPRLRDITFRGLSPPLDSPIFTGLTHLCLSYIHYPDAPIQLFIQNLAACPLLRALVVKNVSFTPIDDSLPQSDSTPVSLPSLEDVRFQVGGRFTRYILDHVQLPLSANIHVAAVDGATLRRILPLPERLDENLPHILSLVDIGISVEPQSVLEIYGAPGKGGGTVAMVLKDPAAIVRPTVERGFASFGLLSLPRLEYISFTGLHKDTLSTDVFADVLRHFPSITSISFTSCSSAFIDALVASPSSHLCPQLETLELRGCKISGARLHALVRSRRIPSYFGSSPGGVGFRKLRLSWCTKPSNGILRGLMMLGVQVIHGEKVKPRVKHKMSAEPGPATWDDYEALLVNRWRDLDWM